jgi:hypothetical protein
VTMVQMPALNTPQFDWCRTRMPRDPQPVPPVFQPEVAAQAIVYAAYHRRRELLVGAPTLKAVWLNKLIPGLLDLYLARFGYASQQAATPVAPGRRDNLFSPVHGGWAAHGRFDATAQRASAALWLTTHRALGIVVVAGLLGVAAALRGRPVPRRVGGVTRTSRE